MFSLPHIEPSILAKVEKCKKFNDYVNKLNSLEKNVEVSQIEILGVEMFGENVGFISMRAITQKDGFKLPSYVFLRGNAVAILMLVNDKILLVEQYRTAIQ